jgi:phosphohistidine swiveling domain-containing protein
MQYIRWFQDIHASDVELVGGKGANLGEMVHAGLPVPPGFCLIARAYRDFIQRTGLEQTIREIWMSIDPQEPISLESAAGRIRGLIISQPIWDSMAFEILESYRKLSQQSRLNDTGPLAVAVRSSATAEDLPTASFAGQQDTYLNVRGEDALLDHVKSCWASLWTARATAYRARQGFDHHKVNLAVVVQAMIPAEISGILFTANPIDGDRDVAVINASWGLGEAIVSGLVTPDTLIIHKLHGKILSHRVASKDFTVCYAQYGGTVTLDTPAERRIAPALTTQQALQLVSLGQKIEHHYGAPQDIEWANACGRWYILQVRPVTGTPAPAAKPAAPQYNRSMFVEIFPDPLTPIFSSVVQLLFQSMLDFTFYTWGFKPPQGIQAVGIFYNQPYFSRDYIEAAFAPLSPAVRDMLVAQVVNPFRDHKGGLQGEISWAYLRMVINTLRFMLTFPRQLPVLLADYRAEVTRIEALPMEKLSDHELASLIKEMVFGFTRKLIDYDFLLIAVVKRVYHLLGMVLEPYFGEQAELLREKLISGVTGNVTMETNIYLWDLAQLAKASPEVYGLFQCDTGRELLLHLEESPDGRAFLEEMNKFLKVFGHREVRLDILYPTWIEDPTPVISFILGYLDISDDQNPHLQQERLSQQRHDLKKKVQARLTQENKGRFLLWPLFCWLLDNAEFHTRERDTVHFEMTRIFPPFRRFLLELGRRWTGRRLLLQPEQVFFLTLDEVVAMADQPRSMVEIAWQRQQEFEINKHRDWPEVIVGNRDIHSRPAEPLENESGRLDGVPGSPGRVTGRACIIHGPEEFQRLRQGDILIAPITNPVWTPLFAIASGVITEVGGILSHGAIVAREYGIPAVMSIPSATRRILDGQTVTVDGDRGFVYIMPTGSYSPIAR